MTDRFQLRVLSLAAILGVAAFVSPTANAEDWPQLADYASRMELVVVATITAIEGEVVETVVDETWVGSFDATYMSRPVGTSGFAATLDEHGLSDVAVGDQVVFFFDQPPVGIFQAHSTSFVIRDGSVVYAETSDFDAVTYTTAQFQQQVQRAPVNAGIANMDLSCATDPVVLRTFLVAVFDEILAHNWDALVTYCDADNAATQLGGMQIGVAQYVAEIFSSGNLFRADNFASLDEIVSVSGLVCAPGNVFTYDISGTVHLLDGRSTPLDMSIQQGADGQLRINGSVG